MKNQQIKIKNYHLNLKILFKKWKTFKIYNKLSVIKILIVIKNQTIPLIKNNIISKKIYYIIK